MNDSDSEDIAVDDEVESEDKAEDDKKNKGEKRKTKSRDSARIGGYKRFLLLPPSLRPPGRWEDIGGSRSQEEAPPSSLLAASWQVGGYQRK